MTGTSINFLLRARMLAFLALTCCGAATAPIVSAPEPLSAPAVSQNADVIWMIRKLDVTQDLGSTDGKHPLAALFACYRKPATAPGAPDCYLAHYTWNVDDLAWPGPVSITKDGRLIVATTPAK